MPTQLRSQCSFLTQSNWLGKKADQSFCIRKDVLGTRLMPTKTMVRAMCKCVQKHLALLNWDWLIYKIQPLVYRTKLILICELGIMCSLHMFITYHSLAWCVHYMCSLHICVQGIMHFIIQSALLDCSFPILVYYISLVYCTSNFRISAIVLTSFVKDTFCLQLH